MAPTIPSSLSPHIVILTSPDLEGVLKEASLPPLPHILQSFSPLPQVTTRTTTLVSVPHSSFALRFSAVQDVEEACREDEDRRAERTIDWITARINRRCAKWVQDMEKMGDRDVVRTPWWDELRRCVEGDFVPSKVEGWNHPMAVILAVSTSSPNPLQAITALHSRNNHFPPWVDTNFLKYTLIIHTKDSPLSDEEATALYNAVKKQYGLHSYLLSLTLPKPPPTPVAVPALMPRLPSQPTPDATPDRPPPTPLSPNVPLGASNPTVLNTLCMAENDIQQTARFTREFVVMSLVPWMEKCVLEWNENFSSTRRLPSRLFSSTRRLFGSPSSTPPPLPGTPPTRTQTLPPMNGASTGPVPPSQQRRLAEFATILGDFKLAITVWEALRKDAKGGADILPLLLAPSSTLKQYAHAALTHIHVAMMDLPPSAQLRAILHGVRWEASIPTRDLIAEDVEGERWLVWAASNAEEAPSALLLAQAALLSSKKTSWRRAALWYTIAASRLEKCGIKPLTMYFLKKAREMYTSRPVKELSPSFWESEGKSVRNMEGLEDILSGLEHPLGRLLYTTGDLSGAVKLFLGLLRGSATFSSLSALSLMADGTPKSSGNDKVYLDDFRVAFNYWKSADPTSLASTKLELPIKLCEGKHSRTRYPGDTLMADADVWTRRQEDWLAFRAADGGKEPISMGGEMSVDELFWVDLSFHNPLDAEIMLANLTLLVQEAGATPETTADCVEVEVLNEVFIGPKESAVVPISMKASKAAKLRISHAMYDFLGLLSVKESLSCRGRRLHDTPLQRQKPTYAPDTLIEAEVVPNDYRLSASFVEDDRLVLWQGETKVTQLWVNNSGLKPIDKVWMVAGPTDELWIGDDEPFSTASQLSEVVESRNSLESQCTRRLPISNLQPGQGIEIPVVFHAEESGEHELCLLFVFREDNLGTFHSTKLIRSYEVQTLCETAITSTPSQSPDHAFTIDIEVANVSSSTSLHVTDIAALSAQWSCRALFDNLNVITPSQSSRFVIGASPWFDGRGSRETNEYVAVQLSHFLKADPPVICLPPTIDLLCSHVAQNYTRSSANGAAFKELIEASRRSYISRHISQNHPSIPPHFHANTFPLYNPSAVDFVICWEDKSQNRFGHINVRGLTLGAGHAALDGVIEEAESAKYKRSMFTETRKENLEIIESIRNSEWNVEMNPLVVTVKDGVVKEHDFSTGPCQVSAEFMLRNHSLSLPARYTLKLLPSANTKAPRDLQPPFYSGRLTFRGTIPASETVLVHPKLWISQPGMYSLSNWTLETEICTREDDERRLSRRYLQEPDSGAAPYILVCDPRTPI